MNHPKLGSRRAPCPRTLAGISSVATIEVTDCGVREIHFAHTTVKFDERGFEEFLHTLQQAAVFLGASSVEPHQPLFASSPVAPTEN
ncbi:MAG: hypothetical protein ACFB9M_21345 [Myxococcota bacterium]